MRFEIQMPWRGKGKQDGYDNQGRPMLRRAAKQVHRALGARKRGASRCRLAGVVHVYVKVWYMRSGCRCMQDEVTYRDTNLVGLRARIGRVKKAMEKQAAAARLQAPKISRRSHLLTGERRARQVSRGSRRRRLARRRCK